VQRQSKLCTVTAHCDDPGINESRVEAELNHSNSPSWGQMKINVDVPCEDRKEQLLSCGVRLGKIIFLGRFVATHQKLKRCLGREGLCTWQSKWLSLFQKKKSKWLSVHILLETDCMHQCGDWRRLWTPRKKICGRLALLLKEVKAHAQRDWEVFFFRKKRLGRTGGWDCSLLKTQKQGNSLFD